MMRLTVPVLAILFLTGGAYADDAENPVKVSTMRVPDGGIQPQVVVDPEGTVHMVFSKGDPRATDIFYVKSTDGGDAFGSPRRVNSEPGSGVAMGTVRGPHLAVGREGRVHVAWIGSQEAAPKGSSHQIPLLYSRLNDEQSGFEPQRNVIKQRPGVDARSSVAADEKGNVYVTWHAPGDGGDGEQFRRVWVAHSGDDGRTFSVERPANRRPTGACVCCAMRGFADRKGNLYILYRSANRVVNRDTYLLTSGDAGASFQNTRVHKWTVGQCMMSAAAFAESPSGVLAAWETRKQVYYGRIDPETLDVEAPVAAPESGPNRRHPAVAGNARGEVILAWTEGTSWGKGGSVAWQVFDADGRARPQGSGRAEGLPVWSAVGVFARPDGGFTVVY